MSSRRKSSSPGKSSSSSSAPTSGRASTFFISGEGIDREVIATDICHYLGNDALVKPGVHQDSKTGRSQEGFYITAYRYPTSDQLANLRADSQKWREEIAKSSARSQGGYDQSATQQLVRMREDPRIQGGGVSYNPPKTYDQMASMTALMGGRPAGYDAAQVAYRTAATGPPAVPYRNPTASQYEAPNYTYSQPLNTQGGYIPMDSNRGRMDILPGQPSWNTSQGFGYAPSGDKPSIPSGYGRGEPPNDYDYGPSPSTRFKSQSSDRTAGSGNSLGDREEAYYANEDPIEEYYYNSDDPMDVYDSAPNATSLDRPGARKGRGRGEYSDHVNLEPQLLSYATRKDHVEETSDKLTSINFSGQPVGDIRRQEGERRVERRYWPEREHRQTQELMEGVYNDNSTSEYIRDTISVNAISENLIFTIRCQVDWELAQYCTKELNDTMSLLRVLTITGSPQHAQAASCEDYVRQTWGEEGLKLLDAIVTGFDKDSVEIIAHNVRTVIKGFKLSLNSPEKVELSVSGVLEDAVLTITFFAWLAATFRLPKADGLTISKVDFQYVNGSFQNGSTRTGWFRLSLCSPKEEIVNQKPDIPSGACWLPLFQGGVISYGFPIAKREEGEGIEIPFELLQLFAGVKGSMEYEAANVYVGPSRILFPTKILRNGVQWHYVESNDKQVLVDALNTCKSRFNLQDISIRKNFRVFLGSYKHALVYAGTQEGIESSQINDSGAPKSSSRLELAKEIALSGLAGIAAPGVSIGLGAKLVLPRSLQVSLEGVRDYDDRLESASQRPILAYDLSARSAWLVSELSMILHMVHKYLSPEKLQSRRRHGEDQMPWPSLPFAQPSADGGKEAYEVIRDSGDLPLYTRREDGKPQKFWNEIDTLLKVFVTIRTEDFIQKKSTGWKFRKPRLRGWDFNDLATKEETVFQRELHSDNKKSPWWSLAEADDMVVLFGCGFGQLIRPDLAKIQPYGGWESIPSQAELLTASMPCVKRLASKCNNTGSCEKLTSELFWHKPTSRSCKGNFICTDGCLYVQELRNQGLLGTSQPNPPGERLCRNDAVIFGEIDYYHEAIRKKLLQC